MTRYLTDRRRLEALAYEAAAHGDQAQVELCHRALEGDLEAIVACVRVLQAAEAANEPAPLTQPMTLGRWGQA